MICSKCGQDNPDDARTCLACGRKLWSGRKGVGDETRANGQVVPFLRKPSPLARRILRKHLEAWVVAVLVWAATYWLVRMELYWPLYPLAMLAAAYAWGRGITWKD